MRKVMKQQICDWNYVDQETRSSMRFVISVLAVLLIVGVIVLCLLLSSGKSEEVVVVHRTKAVIGDLSNGQEEGDEEKVEDEIEEENPETETEQVELISQATDARQEKPNLNQKVQNLDPALMPPAADQQSQRADEMHIATQNKVKKEKKKTQPKPHKQGGLAEENSEDIVDATIGNKEIEEGKTAPYYTLNSQQEFQNVVNRYQGQYVAFDGIICIRLGKSLKRDSHWEVLDHQWFNTYSHRMVGVPESEEVTSLHKKIIKKYSRVKSKKLKILLSVPHRVDREVYRAQIVWFEEQNIPIDVKAKTIGSFMKNRKGGARFVIERVVDRHGDDYELDSGKTKQQAAQ